MKFSESWLREWVNPSINREQLAHQITMAGLEVDDILPVAADFSGVVIGEVIACDQHPDADKLRVTKIDIGAPELLDIVCGAPNCRLGLKVAVATIGAVLPGDFKIKKTKLRGQPSNGMLCSFTELGIDIEADGIIEFPLDAPLGTNVRDYLNLDDASIDVDLTANRADCLSIKGLAREVGVLNRQTVTYVEAQEVTPASDAKVTIDVKAPAACPRYLGRVIKNVNVAAATPLWMQEKLRRSGIRSIDPIVDITNFVMLEQGNPMHAFDLAQIEGGIVVRMAKQEEKLVLLDGTEVTLKENTLVVADSTKALAIAGVFGGKASGVTTKTQDILLESAFFAPDIIRGRARSYGLHTDSSHRFERGVDSMLQRQAIERATALVLDVCGGEAGEIVEQVSAVHLPQAASVTLRRTKLDSLLGHSISSEDVVDILTRLGCTVTESDEAWVITAPSWRFDIAIEQDLIEEVGRVYGYDNIPTKAPIAALNMNPHNESKLAFKRVRDLLVDRGFNEAITYSFVEPSQQKLVVPDVEPLMLPNPISTEMSAMRLSLLTGLLNTVAYNQKRQQTRVRLFESGLRFIPDPQAENGMRQEMMLAGVITGNLSDEHWSMTTSKVDFFDLKGDVESILALTAKGCEYRFVKASHPAMHPGQTAAIEINNEHVGFIGTVHPELERKFDLNGRTVVFELEWSKIDTRKLPEAVSLSKFPVNRRDIAVIVADDISSDDVVRACIETKNTLITDAKLFDLYKGKGVEEGNKSLAITLSLQSTERTLEEKDIAEAVCSVIEKLASDFNAQLRD